MALIKCEECGQMVSEKASACPHCGCPVVANESTMDYGTQAQNSNMNHKPKRKSNTGLIVVVLGVLALLSIGGWLLYDNQQKRIILEQMQEQVRQDSIAVAELRENARQDSIAMAQKEEQINTIYKEYVKVLKNHHDGYYFLFDITKDGIPELWIHAHNRDEKQMGYQFAPLHVFTFKERAKELELGESGIFAFWGDFHQGKNCIIRHTIYDDIECTQTLAKITYDGNKVIETIIRDCCCNKEISPSEPKVDQFNLSDYKSLKQNIKFCFEN